MTVLVSADAEQGTLDGTEHIGSLAESPELMRQFEHTQQVKISIGFWSYRGMHKGAYSNKCTRPPAQVGACICWSRRPHRKSQEGGWQAALQGAPAPICISEAA